MDSVTVDVQDGISAALDRLGDAAAPLLLAVAKESAESIKADVQARIRRQTNGTGRTANAVTVDQVEGGYRVHSGDMQDRAANLPTWLEYGTKHMTPKPAWNAAILLQQGTHMRRLEDAMQAAIDGLGVG